MPTPVYGLLSSVANGANYTTGADAQATTIIENALLFVAELFGGVGIVGELDFNGTAVPGQGTPTVDISAGRAILGSADARRFYRSTATVRISGLENNCGVGAPNYVWLKSTVSTDPPQASDFAHSRDPVDQPAGSVLVCTCEACNNDVTNVNKAPAGRKNIIDALAVRVSADDVQPGYLATKLAAGSGISLTADAGGDERLTIALSPSPTAANDFLVASDVGVWAKQTLAEVKTTLDLGTAAYTPSTDYPLLAGRDGGQTLYGGTGANNNLTLKSTSATGGANKGSVVVDAGNDFNSVRPNFVVQDSYGRKTGLWGSQIARIDTNEDDIDLAINYVGYEGGADKYRSVTIYDGKHNAIAYFRGSTGHFGIGTTEPAVPLHVQRDGGAIGGTAYYNAWFRQAGANRGVGLGYDTSDTIGVIAGASPSGSLAFWTHDGSAYGERLRITNKGDLGLGLAVPTLNVGDRASRLIHLHNPAADDTENSTCAIHLTNGSTGAEANSGLIIGRWFTGDNYLSTYENERIVLGTSNSDRVQVSADGALGIHTITSDPANQSGWALIFVDSTGVLKVKYGGSVKTIVTQ